MMVLLSEFCLRLQGFVDGFLLEIVVLLLLELC